jgi:hypothetical protein
LQHYLTFFGFTEENYVHGKNNTSIKLVLTNDHKPFHCSLAYWYSDEVAYVVIKTFDCPTMWYSAQTDLSTVKAIDSGNFAPQILVLNLIGTHTTHI